MSWDIMSVNVNWANEGEYRPLEWPVEGLEEFMARFSKDDWFEDNDLHFDDWWANIGGTGYTAIVMHGRFEATVKTEESTDYDAFVACMRRKGMEYRGL